MKPDREELIRRRRDLQRRNAREIQRRSVAGVLAELEAAGVTYDLIWPDDVPELGWNWIEQRFPIGFARVAWSEVPGARSERWNTDQERDRLFRGMLEDHIAHGSNLVAVVWGNAAKPSIVLSAGAIHEHCSILLDSDFDTWVYSPSADWLIECYHEGELWCV